MERWEILHRWDDGNESKEEAKIHAREGLHLDAMVQWESLEAEVTTRLPAKDTRLNIKLGSGDPDDSYSRVPYEKGFHLLFALENLVGETVFLGLMRAYLKKFQYGFVTSEDFRDFCIKYLEGVRVRVQEFDWDTWLNGEGMPPKPSFDDTLAKDAKYLCDMWIKFDIRAAQLVPPTTDISNWSTSQKVYFLNRIQATIAEIDDSGRPKKLKLSTIKAMKESYQFDQSTNCELLLEFCKIAIQCGDEEIFPVVVRFITTQGRMKYVRPLYRELFKSSPAGRRLAVQTFLSSKDFYHPIAAKMLATDLGAGVNANESSSDSAKVKTGKSQALHNKFLGSTTLRVLIGGTILAAVFMRKRK